METLHAIETIAFVLAACFAVAFGLNALVGDCTAAFDRDWQEAHEKHMALQKNLLALALMSGFLGFLLEVFVN